MSSLRASALTFAPREPFSAHTSPAQQTYVQAFATGLLGLALASEAAGTMPIEEMALLALEQPQAAHLLPRLPFVPDWRLWLPITSLRVPLPSKPGPAPVRRLQLRWVYRRLVELPELDRMGRFAHVDVAMSGVSGGPELLRLAPEPPREDYSRAQELTPGWSWWYVSADRWAVGVATGTRFLIFDHAGTIVDPFTSEARCAFFLP